MATDGSPEPTSWDEATSAKLIATIKRSQFAVSCFQDARHFALEGYVMVVALKMSWNYWGS